MTSIVGFLVVLGQRIPAKESVFHSNAGTAIIGIVGAITAFAAFASWGLAVYHWGSRFPATSPDRRKWGRIVIFGAFIGRWLYGFFGAREGRAEAI